MDAVTSWLDRWAERTRAKDRETLDRQREVDQLRTQVPRDPVVGPSGVAVTIRIERNGFPVGEGLDRRGDNRRALGMIFNSGNNPYRYEGFSVYAFAPERPPYRESHPSEVLAWRAARRLVEEIMNGEFPARG